MDEVTEEVPDEVMEEVTDEVMEEVTDEVMEEVMDEGMEVVQSDLKKFIHTLMVEAAVQTRGIKPATFR